MATLNFAGFVSNPETGDGVGGITVSAHLVLGDKTLTAGAAATTSTSSGVDSGYWTFSVVTSTDGAQYAIKYVNPANGQTRYQRPEGQMQIGVMQGTLVGGVLVAPVPDGSVTSAKIADAAITSAKLGALAVTAGKINTGAIATADIGNAQVTAAKVAADVATQAELDAHAGSTHLKALKGTYTGDTTGARAIPWGVTPTTVIQAVIYQNTGIGVGIGSTWKLHTSSAQGQMLGVTSNLVDPSTHVGMSTNGFVLNQLSVDADAGANGSGCTYTWTLLYL